MYKDIDEAIKQLTENYNFWMQFACDDCLEEGEHKVNNCEENANSCYQIIRWLEELKAFRKNKTFKIGKDSHSWEVGYDKGYEQGRQDAIDEFIKKCKTTHDGLICNWDKPYGITFERMEEKAKELKESNK